MIDRAGNFVFAGHRIDENMTVVLEWNVPTDESARKWLRFPRRAGEAERMRAEWLRDGRRA